YAEYQRATDYGYRQTTQLVARLNLPPETANSLYAIQKEFEDRRTTLYRINAGNPEEVAAQSAALQKEAVDRIAPILGDASRVDPYKQYGGNWLNNFTPRPAAASTKK